MAEFVRRDDARAFGLIALDWALVFGCAILAWNIGHPLAHLAAIVVIAGRQTAMLNLTHAASHRALFSKQRWHERLELLYSLPIADTVARYRTPHLEHHREIATRTPDRFAFLHGELKLPERGALGRTWAVFVRPLLGHAALSFTKSTLKQLFTDATFRKKQLAFWIPVVAIAVLAGVATPFLLYWVLPLFWLHPVFLLWGEVSDHFQAPGGTRDHVGFFHMAFINGHALYHDVHHRFPYVPFYREPEAWRFLVQERAAAPEISRSALDFVRRVYGAAPPDA
ncbi:fatty acid desaturase [Myxococcota bacterium]|nr:fatty acid desaturase [Myxococcota bacterium]